jgi:ketosteroid isomerase-like protein
VSRRNLEIVREIYARFNRRDYAAMWELMADDIEMSFPDWVGYPRQKHSFVGREGAARFWRDVFGTFEEFRMEPEKLVDRGDCVAARLHDTGRGKASGVAVDLYTGGVWTLRDGKAIRFEIFETLEEAIAACPAADDG